MSQPFSVRDISTPGDGHRVLEVTIVRADTDDLAVRVILDAAGQRAADSRSSELRLAAALAVEVAEHVADRAAPAVIEISVPERPGPAKVTYFAASSHTGR